MIVLTFSKCPRVFWQQRPKEMPHWTAQRCSSFCVRGWKPHGCSSGSRPLSLQIFPADLHKDTDPRFCSSLSVYSWFVFLYIFLSIFLQLLGRVVASELHSSCLTFIDYQKFFIAFIGKLLWDFILFICVWVFAWMYVCSLHAYNAEEGIRFPQQSRCSKLNIVPWKINQCS